ncbi:alanine racemase [Paenibacillus sp. J2TS4]|uniref:alanine racemase n=1 Tax=Paenibacillus sp. J2TS4 TaxID=2807194 RepID=UPI001B0305E7|nr:alanine racemase [Paenibacillus sp. J2TS4]GIP34995.1 alanine racemase [Paenibacillus sp. J2TS4]
MSQPIPLEEIETPAVLIDLDVLESNLLTTARLAAEAGVRLRPHTKTHKSVWIAQQQIKHGACGITVAKLGEAEVMAEAGIHDILIAFPIVGKAKLKRLAKLMEIADIKVSVDHMDVARGLSELGEALNRRIPLYVDVNTGLNRCGMEPGEETGELVKQIAQLPGVEVRALMTHGGYSYSKTSEDELRSAARQEAELLVETQQWLARAGVEVPEISIGSTPTSKYIGEQSGVSEIRPGAYVFGDGGQLSIGIIDESQCAMTVMTTVVSTPRPGTVIVDGGSKTFSYDGNSHRPGFGVVRGNHDIYMEKFSEEHGNVRVPAGASYRIGERLFFIPNHCCTTTNLHDQIYGVRNGQVESIITIDARGKVT